MGPVFCDLYTTHRTEVRGTKSFVPEEHGLKYGVRLLLPERGTESTGYEEYRAGEVQILVRSLFSAPSTGSTEYEEDRTPGVRILARGTAIFTSTGYEEYGVRGVLKFV